MRLLTTVTLLSLLTAATASAHEHGDARLDVQIGEATGEVAREAPIVPGGMFDRPYLARVGGSAAELAIGGYFDFVGNYVVEDGISEGFSFEARRFNLFVTSRIAEAIRLTSEIEFEHGAEEIALETALIDVLFHHAINLRGGILLAPIGKFNIAHDAPLYDIIDRPLVSTEIIPSTLSDVGIGLFGALYPGGRSRGGSHRLTYELYAVNGLGDGVVAADGTRIADGKNLETFEEDNNGSPAVVGRLAYVSPANGFMSGEIGISAYAGIYNTHEIEGETVDEARWLRITALDATASFGPATIRGELAFAHVDLPPSLTDLHSTNQFGFYTEGGYRFFEMPMGPFDQTSLSGAFRVDYVNLNLGHQQFTGEPLGDDVIRLTFGPSFRPDPATSIRAVYRHEWITDLLGNPLRSGGVQLGISSYF